MLILALIISIKEPPACRLDSDLDWEANLKESLSSLEEAFFPQEDDALAWFAEFRREYWWP